MKVLKEIKQVDVVIVGAGLGGLATLFHLRQTGSEAKVALLGEYGSTLHLKKYPIKNLVPGEQINAQDYFQTYTDFANTDKHSVKDTKPVIEIVWNYEEEVFKVSTEEFIYESANVVYATGADYRYLEGKEGQPKNELTVTLENPVPRLDLVKDITQDGVKLDYSADVGVVVDHNNESNILGLYAVGDTVFKEHNRVITTLADAQTVGTTLGGLI